MYCFHWKPLSFLFVCFNDYRIIGDNVSKRCLVKKKKRLWRCKIYYQDDILYTKFHLRKYTYLHIGIKHKYVVKRARLLKQFKLYFISLTCNKALSHQGAQ